MLKLKGLIWMKRGYEQTTQNICMSIIKALTELLTVLLAMLARFKVHWHLYPVVGKWLKIWKFKIMLPPTVCRKQDQFHQNLKQRNMQNLTWSPHQLYSFVPLILLFLPNAHLPLTHTFLNSLNSGKGGPCNLCLPREVNIVGNWSSSGSN